MIGETVGNYRIVSVIGEGGMGIVYLAEHSLLGRKAAVKVLRPEVSASPSVLDRFFKEARAAAAVKHPGLINIFDFGKLPSGAAYIVMEFLEGESLAERIRRMRRIPPSRNVEISRQLAEALAAAHEANIVHRDLKPDNIFLLGDPAAPEVHVKVLDFGVAKLGGDLGGGRRTNTGAMLGTPCYMSPEQCRGSKDVDGRADVYSLGCVMFEMACGRPPYGGDGAGDIMAAHIRDPIPRPSEFAIGLPGHIDDLIVACLAKRPEDRPQSMIEVLEALQEGAEGSPPERARLPKGAPSLDQSFDETINEARTGLAASAARRTPQPGQAPRGRGATILISALAFLALAAGGYWLSEQLRSAPPAPVAPAGVVPSATPGKAALPPRK